MSLQGNNTKAWFGRAQAALVNGVSSQFRYWGDEDTIVIDRGEGGHLYDMDGKRYIDFQLGFGPVILGHGDPAVVDAVAAAAAEGASYAMTQRREIEAAEKVLAALRWADRIRFTNTGTEATMHAIRLARGVTGRDIVVKFEGQYHGVHDYVMFSTASAPYGALGSPMRPIPVQSSSGIPDQIRSYIRTLPYNDLESVSDLFQREGNRVAAVIVEPMLGNVFGLLPADGFLEGLRSLTAEHGAALIFDEVKTGFRIALGGAAEYFGVIPDIGTFAKAMGNGFPVAAIAVTGKFVDGWQKGGIAQAGTYSGNGVAVAAAGATVERLSDGDALGAVEHVGRSLMDGVEKVLADHGVAGKVTGHPSMFSIYLGEGEPGDYRDTKGHDEDLYEDITMRMIKKGVMPCPDAKEPWFVCAAHSDDDVAVTLQVFEESLGEARAGR